MSYGVLKYCCILYQLADSRNFVDCFAIFQTHDLVIFWTSIDGVEPDIRKHTRKLHELNETTIISACIPENVKVQAGTWKEATCVYLC